MLTVTQDLKNTLMARGFRLVNFPSGKIPNAELILKRQTWNTNRAVVLVSLPEIPEDFGNYIKNLRKQVAFSCGFFPFFYGIGIQALIAAPGLTHSAINP
ncbi:MAG: hypothetical protein U1F57_05715 [bacterium]